MKRALLFKLVLFVLLVSSSVFGALTAYKHWNDGLGVWDESLTTNYLWDDVVGTGGAIDHLPGGNGDFPAGNSGFQGCVEFVPPAVLYHHDYDGVIWNNAEGTIEVWVAPHWNGENQGGTHTNGTYQDVITGDGIDELPCTQGFNVFFFDNNYGPTPGYQLFVCYTDNGGATVYEHYEVGNTMDWIAGEWHHICVSWDASEVMAGLDGVIFMKKTRNGGFNMASGGYLFGMKRASGPENTWDGWADDLAIHDTAFYTGLGDVGDSYPVPTIPAQYSFEASDPEPWDDEMDVYRNTKLRWTSGPGTVVAHKVYFDSNEANVVNRTTLPVILNASDSNCSVPVDHLEQNTVYYWAVDEVNDGMVTHSGELWKFTTERKELPVLMGDVSKDYKVDFKDIAIFVNQYLDDISPWALLCAELNNEKVVDNSDYSLLANNISESDIPLGFKVLGTIVPPEYEPAPTYGFTEILPDTHTDYYRASNEELARGYLTYVKNYLDYIYPITTPQFSEVTSELSAFSVPGEYEPVTFTIYAIEDMEDVSVSVSDLTGPGGTSIESRNIEVRSVRCWPRKVWGESHYQIRPWFLEKRDTLNIAGAESKRYWITVWVPAGASAGTYNGTVNIEVSNLDDYALSLELEVLDIELMVPATLNGMYYCTLNLITNPIVPYSDEYFYKEIMNMKEHGMNTMFVSVPPPFSGVLVGDEVIYDLSPLEFLVETYLAAGFREVTWNLSISEILPGYEGPGTFGQNLRGFHDGFLARGWSRPVGGHGDESDANGSLSSVLAWLAAAKQAVPEMKTSTTIVFPENLELYEPDLDIRAFSSYIDTTVIAPTRAAGRKLGQYSGSSEGRKEGRFYRGIWGAVMTLDSMADWTYFYLYNRDALFDDLNTTYGGPNHRGHVLPGLGGPLPRPVWEGLREGIEDGKYLYTIAELIERANASGDPTLISLAASAQSYLDGLYDQVDDIPNGQLGNPFPHTTVCESITDLEFFDDFRLAIAGHIQAIEDALGALP